MDTSYIEVELGTEQAFSIYNNNGLIKMFLRM